MHYNPQTFNVPELDGISRETIDEHIGLYNGYVKHANLIREKIDAYSSDPDNNAYAMGEMQRRFGFEFGGMRNHEYYFTQFEDGAKALPDGKLKTMIESQWGNFDNWYQRFMKIAMTRGVGWAMLYIDRQTDQLIETWVDEQHLGQLADLDIVLALDMWEHSYMRDYPASKKKEYVDAFFRNLNWEVVASRVA
ncbi:MAG TPA: Fe-Mn family superoxide dismutase [Candidatus Paceibacterota bacterium]|nr:Fe-Mn family superoxide dismutase [Candidatus Paceibacterota bacterium]